MNGAPTFFLNGVRLELPPQYNDFRGGNQRAEISKVKQSMKNNNTIKIWVLGNGWYDFKDIPQGYVKIHGLNVGSDDKALAQAKKINPNYDYELAVDWGEATVEALRKVK